jgi:transcriptional regulator of acetoin/glycerol metabolism
VTDLPSSLQNHIQEKKSQFLMAAATARPLQFTNEFNHFETPTAPPLSESQTLPSIIPIMELERRAIMNALEYTRGDRTIAAHLLGIGRTTLYRKLKDYELMA